MATTLAKMAADPQELNAHNKKIFDQMSNSFDNRDYDKTIKFAEQILSSNPNHGETLAMKGLTLHTQGKTEEGLKFAKDGVLKNLKSTVAWHCLGLVQKGDKNHVEAVKAFKRSVIVDPHNLNAARDLSSSSIQIRDWPQFVESRQMMLSARAGVRQHWIALSCAHYMNGNVELALAVVDLMVQLMEAGTNPHEVAEVHLYRAELELLLKRPTKAIEVLNKHDREIKDEPTKNMLKAKAYASLGQVEKADKLYKELIANGISEADSLVAMAKCRGISIDAKTRLPVHHCNRSNPNVVDQCNQYVELLDEINRAAPRCDASKRFALDTCSDEAFEGRLRAYIKPFILKMIPSVTFILKSLYNYFPATDSRIAAIGKVFHSWEAELERDDYEAFYGVTDGTAAPSVERNPALLLWVYQFLASHYLRTKNYAKAHEYADKAIDHTPTIEMLYLLKAKICSREGDLAKAAELADTARVLDLQDKYLSAKAAKYFFRVGDVTKAEANLKLFMKQDEDPASTYLTALEAQTIWYERECGDAFMIKNDPISALQNYAMFEKHTKDNWDELVDFHNYTFRRCTMRQWIEVQEKQEQIGLQRFFLLICPRMVKAYMTIAAEGEEAARSRHVPRPAPVMTEGEKDKEKESEEKHKQKSYDELYLKDIDITDPLGKARRYVDALLHYSPNEAATHSIAIEYFLALETVPVVLVARSLQTLKTIAKADGTGVRAVTTSLADRTKAAEAVEKYSKTFAEKWASLKAKADARVIAVVEAAL